MELISRKTNLIIVDVLCQPERVDYVISVLKSFIGDEKALNKLKDFLTDQRRVDYYDKYCEFDFSWSTGCEFANCEAFGYILSINVGGALDPDVQLFVNAGTNNEAGKKLIAEYGEDFFSDANCRLRLFELFKDLVYSLV